MGDGWKEVGSGGGGRGRRETGRGNLGSACILNIIF